MSKSQAMDLFNTPTNTLGPMKRPANNSINVREYRKKKFFHAKRILAVKRVGGGWWGEVISYKKKICDKNLF